MATHFFGLTSRTYKYSHAVGRAEFAGTGFRNPTDMAIAADGTVYICNRSYENRPDGVHITVITMDEDYVTEFGAYGESDGEFMWPTSVALDSKGNVYIAEREGNGVRKVDANGVMSIFSGTGEFGYSGDGGPALTALWGAPKALRCDHRDDLIVVDTENNAVRFIDVKTAIVTTIAGGHQGGDGDGGPATDAGLERPHGCGIDRQGNLFIADGINHRVRVVGMR